MFSKSKIISIFVPMKITNNNWWWLQNSQGLEHYSFA